MKDEVIEISSKLISLEIENDELKKENNNLKSKVTASSYNKMTSGEIEKEVINLNQELTNMKNKELANQTEIRNLNNELDKLRDIKSNNEKLNIEINKLKNENGELNKKINNQLNPTSNNNNKEYDELNKKYLESLSTISGLEIKLKNTSSLGNSYSSNNNNDNYQFILMKVYIYIYININNYLIE